MKEHQRKPDPKKEVHIPTYADSGETRDGTHINHYCKCGKQIKKSQYSNGRRWVDINHQGGWP